MENKIGLGETFVNGRIINLDTVEISDLERYINEVDKGRENAKVKLDRLLEEIKRI